MTKDFELREFLYSRFYAEANVQDKVIESYEQDVACLLYTSPSPRDRTRYRMPSSA